MILVTGGAGFLGSHLVAQLLMQANLFAFWNGRGPLLTICRWTGLNW